MWTLTDFHSPLAKVSNCLTTSTSFSVDEIVSLCSLGCPGNCHVDQAGLKLRYLPGSTFLMLGLKVCATKHSPVSETCYLSESTKWNKAGILFPNDMPYVSTHHHTLKLRKLSKIERPWESALVRRKNNDMFLARDLDHANDCMHIFRGQQNWPVICKHPSEALDQKIEHVRTDADLYLFSKTGSRLQVRTLLCSPKANTQTGGQIYRKKDCDWKRRKPEKHKGL